MWAFLVIPVVLFLVFKRERDEFPTITGWRDAMEGLKDSAQKVSGKLILGEE